MSILAVLPIIGEIVKRVIPDPIQAAEVNLKVATLAQSGALAQLDADLKLAVGQMEVNKIEAASSDLFRGGWRPAVGWICALGLFYDFFLRPLLPWVAKLLGAEVPPLPPTDMGTLITMLGGLLGLGTLRTVERVKGKA